MTEENSSDGSEYYDFTPSKQQTYTEGDEELDWDEYEEALSVVDPARRDCGDSQKLHSGSQGQ